MQKRYGLSSRQLMVSDYTSFLLCFLLSFTNNSFTTLCIPCAGFYAPFQENSVNQFVSSNDADRRNGREPSLFRSSERQQIIDFIIRSRIRNFGAELGEDKKLGKDIELRVPIHMHARLEGLYISWVLFYKEVNWVNARNTMRPITERLIRCNEQCCSHAK